jgi:hypothetical protein
MKIAAVLFNIILLGLTIFILIDEGIDTDTIFYYLIFIITPLLSLYTILSTKNESWLSLFLKRKALEEKKKIEKLQ